MTEVSKPIYHITHINNLESILGAGGLLAYKPLREAEANYTNIAYYSIQYRRATTRVPCGAGGVLHDYVPFYFAPRSPMLYTISRGNVEGYTEGQTPVIHLVSTVEEIEVTDLRFAFTDGHATVAFTEFYDDLNALDEVIDWELMESRYWSDTDEDNDRKRRRQAEFLVYKFFPWELISKIGVENFAVKTQVEQILQNVSHQPEVTVSKNWYY